MKLTIILLTLAFIGIASASQGELFHVPFDTFVLIVISYLFIGFNRL